MWDCVCVSVSYNWYFYIGAEGGGGHDKALRVVPIAEKNSCSSSSQSLHFTPASVDYFLHAKPVQNIVIPYLAAIFVASIQNAQ